MNTTATALFQHAHFCVYFGDSIDHISHDDTGQATAFETLKKKIAYATQQSSPTLFFLKQTHSADVYLLENSPHKDILFQQEGDAIITTEKNIGIGIITADCLPILLFDPINKAIGAIHAGWRGLSKKIITNTLQKMQQYYHTDCSNLLVYLGASASSCCYEVQPDFTNHFASIATEKNIIEHREGKIFFNAKNAAIAELLENNVMASNININHHCCTICNSRYHSYRRQKELAGRQASFIFLKTRYCA